MMDARDICRRLNCSPITLADWVERGSPIMRYPPDARFELPQVKQWLTEQGINEWPVENDHDLDKPIRVLLRALQQREITPWQAEKIIFTLGSGIWG